MNPVWTAPRWRWLTPPVLLGSGLFAVMLVRLFQHWRVPLPPCGLRTLTGLPCPTCGGTRALLALSELEIAAAFRFNPLVTLAALALCGWTALWVLDLCLGRNWAGRILSKAQQSPWPWPLGVAAALNWVYLLFYLPR